MKVYFDRVNDTLLEADGTPGVATMPIIHYGEIAVMQIQLIQDRNIEAPDGSLAGCVSFTASINGGVNTFNNEKKFGDITGNYTGDIETVTVKLPDGVIPVQMGFLHISNAAGEQERLTYEMVEKTENANEYKFTVNCTLANTYVDGDQCVYETNPLLVKTFDDQINKNPFWDGQTMPDVGQGQFVIILDAKTVSFAQRLLTRDRLADRTQAYFELLGYDTHGNRNATVRFPICCKNAIDREFETPPPVPQSHYTKGEADARFNRRIQNPADGNIVTMSGDGIAQNSGKSFSADNGPENQVLTAQETNHQISDFSNVNWAHNAFFWDFSDNPGDVPAGWELLGAGAGIEKVTDGGTIGGHAVRITRNGNDCGLHNMDRSQLLSLFCGQHATFTVDVKCSTPDAARIVIYDGTNQYESAWHSGSGNWERLDIACDIAPAATEVCVRFEINTTDTSAEFSTPMLAKSTNTPKFTPDSFTMGMMRSVPLNINAESGLYTNRDWNNINIGFDPTKAQNEAMMADAVLDTGIAPGSGILFVSSQGEANEMYKLTDQTLTPVTADANFSTTKDNAGTFNIYFETDQFKVQNKAGDNKSVKISLVEM